MNRRTDRRLRWNKSATSSVTHPIYIAHNYAIPLIHIEGGGTWSYRNFETQPSSEMTGMMGSPRWKKFEDMFRRLSVCPSVRPSVRLSHLGRPIVPICVQTVIGCCKRTNRRTDRQTDRQWEYNCSIAMCCAMRKLDESDILFWSPVAFTLLLSKLVINSVACETDNLFLVNSGLSMSFRGFD